MTSDPQRHADRLLAIHGADPARWPATERANLQQADPDERAAEAQLDLWLAGSVPPPPSAQLRASLMAAAHQAAAARRPGWREALAALWQDLGGTRVAAPVFALALAAGVGLGSGLLPGLETAQADEAEDLLSLALVDDSYGGFLTEAQP